jgi:hypothetical protein
VSLCRQCSFAGASLCWVFALLLQSFNTFVFPFSLLSFYAALRGDFSVDLDGPLSSHPIRPNRQPGRKLRIRINDTPERRNLIQGLAFGQLVILPQVNGGLK